MSDRIESSPSYSSTGHARGSGGGGDNNEQGSSNCVTSSTDALAPKNCNQEHAHDRWSASCTNLACRAGQQDLWLRLPSDGSRNNPERHEQCRSTVVARDGVKGRVVPRFTVSKGERATVQFEAYCVSPDESLAPLMTFGVGAAFQHVDESAESMYESLTRDAVMSRTDLPSRFSSDFAIRPPLLTIYEGLRVKTCERQRSRPGGPNATPYTACIDWKGASAVLSVNMASRFVGDSFEMEHRRFSCSINHGDPIPASGGTPPVLYFQFYSEAQKGFSY